MAASVLSGLLLLVLATSARSLHWSNQAYITKLSTDGFVAASNINRANDYTLRSVQGRPVLIYSPPGNNFESKRPAVLVLHGDGDVAADMPSMTHFDDVSRGSKANFLVVYPEMIERYSNRDWVWQVGNPKEIEFFQDVSSLLRNEFGAGDLYVVGHSVGGTMSLYLQNVMPGVFTGAAAVEAGVGEKSVQFWNSTSYGRPTIVLFNHNDNVLQQFGGEELYNQTLSVLRRLDRSHTKPSSAPMFSNWACSASQLYWPGVGQQPPTAVVSWKSLLPSHCWLCPKEKVFRGCHAELVGCPLDAASIVWEFLQSQQVHEWKKSI